MVRVIASRLVFLCSLATALCLSATNSGLAATESGGVEVPPPASQTSDYAADTRYSAVLEIIDAAAQADHVRRIDFGETVEGRDLAAAVVANPPVERPADLRDDDRLVVLLLGNIHSGESAGKEALLGLLGELANRPDHPWLERLVVIIAPSYNADGGERLGANHRPGQIGPDVAGRRENAQDLDLNRDFTKLDAPETRALLRLLNRWNPHLFIDTHTTNGSRHRYELTYEAPLHPAAPAQVRDYLRDTLLPEATRRLEGEGISTFYYGNLSGNRETWSTFGYGPRYSTDYVGMRGRLAILSEAYSYATYQKRISATRRFVSTCLDLVAEDADSVSNLLRQARRARPQEIPIQAEARAFAESATIKAYAADEGDQVDVPAELTVEFVGDFQPTRSVSRPAAYVLPANQLRAVDRLLMHGIRVQRLEAAADGRVEVSKVTKLQRDGAKFQGHHLLTLETETRAEDRTLPAGSYVLLTDQPLGTLAAVLLEAGSPDSLAAWNFFDRELAEGKDYPVLRLPDSSDLPLARVRQIAPSLDLELDSIFGPEKEVSFSGGASAGQRWLTEGRYLRNIAGRRVVVDAETGAVEPFLFEEQLAAALAKLPEIGAEPAGGLARGARLNEDGTAALLDHAGDLFYFHAGEEEAVRLTHTPQIEERMPTFSPDGRFVAYIADHNLHVASTADGRSWPLTTHGEENLLCGELDWVYQEELYGRGNFKGFWWSPDSNRLAFLEIDESPVLRYTVVDHQPYRQRLEVTPYPKAGDPLPKVRLGIVAAAGGDVRWVEHEEYTAIEHLLVRVGWDRDGDRVLYQVQDRPQNWLDVRSAPATGGASQKLFREASEAWVEALDDVRELADGRLLWRSDRIGHRQLYLVSADGAEFSSLTEGPFDVFAVEHVDEEVGWVYFTATRDSPIELHGYRVRIDGGDLERVTELGSNHSVQWSPDGRYFFDSASSAERPPHTALRRGDGALLRSLAPNLPDELNYYRLGKTEFVQPTARDGRRLNAMVVTPSDYDPSRAYPVLCYVYGGPQAPQVWNRWGGSRALWHQMLAQRGCIVWVCDPRAASSVGIEAARPIYERMGEHELADLEDGLAWLKDHYHVDESRVGIWGWSYGGYMTAYSLLNSQTFSCGISGAPVTDWRNYDAVYTERYMNLPQNNPEGYAATKLADRADQLHGDLLLIHGVIDDNVHPANTLQLVAALQKANRSFEVMFYPGNRHGISNPQQVRHLYELMTNFWERRLIQRDE